jgi:uncharacterized membrane protein YdjX (TVP38/TMEM64 family)
MTPPSDPADPPTRPRLRRLLPLGGLAAIGVVIWYSGATAYLSWQELARHQAMLLDAVAARPTLAPALYVGLYALFVALSLPQAVVMTVAGGLLFGALAGGALAVLGATAGAIGLFLVARSAFGDTLAERGGAVARTVRDGLRRDGFNYLLAIRLIPVFPFWLVNLAAALGGIRLLPYAAATALGVTPGTFVFASVGAGIGTVLSAGGQPDLGIILSLPVLGPLLGLAALSLLPVVWRRWRKPDA